MGRLLLLCLVSVATQAECAAASQLTSDVVFSRTGGYAGYDDRGTISPAGEVTVTSRNKRRMVMMPRGELSLLAGRLRTSRFFANDRKVSSETTDENKGADFVTFTIRYNAISVVVQEDRVPASLQPVIDQLQRLLAAPPSKKLNR